MRENYSFLVNLLVGAAFLAPAAAQSPDECRRKCAARQQEFIDRCLEAGNSPRECETGGQRVLEECLHRCLPDVDCRRQCQNRAKKFYRDCRHEGGTEEECAQAAREYLQNCIESRCDLTCEERCAADARRRYHHCIEKGGSESDCQARALEFLSTCTGHCQPDCTQACADRTETAFRRCVEEGGTQEQCTHLARRVGAACIAEHCAPRCGGIAGEPCPKGEFCKFRPGECEIADNQGVCVPIPGGCPDVYQPVCGCDGVTYANACEAAAQQVSIDHEGPCEQRCGGTSGVACPAGEFCQFPPGQCDVPDNEGVCKEFCPQCMCITLWDPVCGCDGKTYGNDCEAQRAGVSIDHRGACED